jgi:hypothetical protein
MQSNLRIITQVGDTHSLKFEDIGKRRFIRLDASEQTPDVMQGTIHTSPNFGYITSSDALGQLGLTLTDPEIYDYSSLRATYFITGAIAYTAYDSETGCSLFGILASVRESPSEDSGESEEFDCQYPPFHVDGKWHVKDNSLAKELDAILDKACSEAEDRNNEDSRRQVAARIAELGGIRSEQGGLNATQKAEMDRLLNLQRRNASEPAPGEDDEPEMVHGRLS